MFVVSMNLIIKAAERETRERKIQSRIYIPANRGFMNDLTVTTTHVQARWVLKSSGGYSDIGQNGFQAKEVCMIIKKGRLTERFTMNVQGEMIPSIVQNPVKCLGKWLDDSLEDTRYNKNVNYQLRQWLRSIDRTCLLCKYKTWIYQHGVLSRLMWMMILYKIPKSTAEAMESV